MSDNPYQTPDLNPMQSGSSNEQMRAKVSAPSIALLVAGIINVLMSLLGTASTAMMIAGVYPGMAQQREQMEEMKAQMGDNPFIDFAISMQDFQQSPFSLLLNLFSLAMAVLVIVGALKMRNLQSYGLALAASIIAIIPCFSCCFTGVPIGIWALVVLLGSDVKAAFRQG